MREAMALSEDKYLITRRKLLLLSLPFGYAIVNESKANSNSPIKVLNVLNFGAKGDGINDDSYAFQQACNTASSLGGRNYIYHQQKNIIEFYSLYILAIILNCSERDKQQE